MAIYKTTIIAAAIGLLTGCATVPGGVRYAEEGAWEKCNEQENNRMLELGLCGASPIFPLDFGTFWGASPRGCWHLSV